MLALTAAHRAFHGALLIRLLYNLYYESKSQNVSRMDGKWRVFLLNQIS